MEARSFYGTRRATKVTTIPEAHNAIENVKNVVNIVVLPPVYGDSGSKESDCEDFISDTEELFEPAGEIDVEDQFHCWSRVDKLRVRVRNF